MSPPVPPSVSAPATTPVSAQTATAVEGDTATVADPDTVARAVRACPSVADLSSGVFGEAATYLPGRRVPGVRITDAAVEVHVVAVLGATVTQLAAEVRHALAQLVGDLPVDLVIEDVAVADAAVGTVPGAAAETAAGSGAGEPRHHASPADPSSSGHPAGAPPTAATPHPFSSTHVQGSTDP